MSMRLCKSALIAGMVLNLISPLPSHAQGSVQTELKLGLDHTKVRADKVGKLDEAALTDVLDRRVSALAGGSGKVKVVGVDEIRVRVPLERMTDAQAQMLTRPGKLQFRSLDDVQTNLNPDGRYLINVLTIQGKATLRFQDRRSNQPVETTKVVEKASLLFTNDDLEPNGAQAVGNGALVKARLTERASKRLEEYLRKPGRMIAVVLDGEVVAVSAGITTVTPRRKGKDKERKSEAPAEEKKPEPVGSEIDIPGGFSTPEEASLLAGILNSGVLPFPLTVRSKMVVPVE
jgi:preprotein translocase subunit SecD